MKMDREYFLSLLNKFKSLDIKGAIDFELMNEIFISHHSTGIEGSTLTMEETTLLIKEGIPAKGKLMVEHYMVQDHFNALDWMLTQAKEKKEVTKGLIQELSAKVLKNTGSVINAAAGTYDSSKGEYRKSAVSVGNRYFANYQKIEKEIDNLCKQINERLKQELSAEETYKLAFDSHFYFVTIHPFADGNGRVGRLLMNYILEYKELPLATIFKEDKADYFMALEESRKEEQINLKPIDDFMFSQQQKYFEQEIKKFNNQLDLDNFKL